MVAPPLKYINPTKTKNMEDKALELGTAILSIKRIELLLEEVIFQQILSRTPSEEEASRKYEMAMDNVIKGMKEFADSLPPAVEKDWTIR